MKIIAVDDEGAKLIELAALQAIAYLNVRASRVDPEGYISGSAALQAAKLESVLESMKADVFPRWDQLPAGAQDNFRIMARELAETDYPAAQAALYRRMQATALWGDKLFGPLSPEP